MVITYVHEKGVWNSSLEWDIMYVIRSPDYFKTNLLRLSGPNGTLEEICLFSLFLNCFIYFSHIRY